MKVPAASVFFRINRGHLGPAREIDEFLFFPVFDVHLPDGGDEKIYRWLGVEKMGRAMAHDDRLGRSFHQWFRLHGRKVQYRAASGRGVGRLFAVRRVAVFVEIETVGARLVRQPDDAVAGAGVDPKTWVVLRRHALTLPASKRRARQRRGGERRMDQVS